MKKIVAISLLIIYGYTSVGATIHMHYCMNEFVGWNLRHSSTENKCGRCGMKEMKGGCCKDEHKQIKLSLDQNNNQIKSLLAEQIFAPALIIDIYIGSFLLHASVINTITNNNAPPNTWQSLPLYLSNCVFLI